jgi:glycosyltransferase involved in cell wall biosynthesis
MSEQESKKQPTLCFITMCKNEEHCIHLPLESVYKYIDYWIVCDTGSTDNTCNIVKNFFAEKNIPGELFIDEWKGFDTNKSLMFERAYKKADYILHLDADDFLVGDFDKNILINEPSDRYLFNYIRGNSKFKAGALYDNNLKWQCVGAAHNLFLCIDKPNSKTSHAFIKENLWVDNNERGARKFDPNKYINDAIKLKDQFFNTLYEDPHNLNTRSVFYAAQSYMDSGNFKEAIQWYTLYTKLKNTWNEEEFESMLRIGRCMIHLKFKMDAIVQQLEKAINFFPDRAEPNYVLGKYLNDQSKCDLAYKYLKEAKSKKLDDVAKKYTLFINRRNYEKYVNDELAVSCFWTGKLDEGLELLDSIIDDVDFENHKERLHKNKMHFMNKINNNT